ncbi:alpha-L-fucosidase [Dyadobacter sp. BHUBP1]|uniref:alpha-L-fucosidase n=1 Tax=Dyadobacter sp. BHUBP1 TaxID=3424178 RepID=UPI003D34AFB1
MRQISKLVGGTLLVLLTLPQPGSGQGSKLRITTTSSGEYQTNPRTSLYPAFVDNLSYQSWTEDGPSPFFQLSADGGVVPYTWDLAGGALPNGLELDKNGRIHGMAIREGIYTFTARVTDSKGATASKILTFEAAPYRSKWFSDAKFGIYITWGAYSAPSLKGKDGIAQFEKRITKFNADQWAQTIVDLGGKVLTANVKAGDGVRLWPSTSPSKLELKTKRNIVKELVDACHKKGIRFIAYIAPDNGWNKDIVDTAPDGTYGTLNLGLIRELIALGVDGFWVDMTSATELYQGFDYNWFPWNKIIPILRANNPKVIFANNTGLGNGGTVLQYPNTDVIVYEGGTSSQETALEVAKPATVKKKLAIEVDNLLDNTWSWREDPKLRSPKPVDMMIRNIQKNWEVGATYMLSYPITADGNILPEFYKDRLTQIANFVKKNQGWSVIPEASLSDTIDYSGSQKLTLAAAPRSKIYYTVNGSRPTTAGKTYRGALTLTRTSRVQAIAVEPAKPASKLLDKTFTILNKTPNARSAKRVTATEPTPAGRTDPRDFYRGMRITVGSVQIRLTEVGRKNLAGNSNRHSLIVKRYVDDYPLLTASLNTASLSIDPDGYQYAQIPPLTLEAGKSYVIGFREDSSDLFAASDFKVIPAADDYRVISYSILSPQGAQKPIVDDKIGQLINLKYEKVGPKSMKTNLAIGKQAFLRANNEGALGPASQIYFAENGIDGDPTTMAQAGGQYPWTLLVDLMKIETAITEAKITFGKTAFSTDFQIMASPDNKTWTTLLHKTDNSDLNINIKFSPITARYFKIRSFKPEKSGDRGGSMGILEFEVYQ